MKKWIRWWGIAAFFTIVIFSTIFWYLLADKIIANRIEKSGEYLIGAKVDVGNADLSLFPLGVSIDNLQVANPSSPMQNLFDVDKLFFHLDEKDILKRRIIIKDLVIDGIKFNTKRNTSGEIKGANPLIKQLYDEFVLPFTNIPQLESIIEQEELKSIDGLKDVINDIERINSEWKYIYRTMPKKEDALDYRRRANTIIIDIRKNRVTGLIKHARAINVLKGEIERDIDEINLNKMATQIDIDSIETKKRRAQIYIESDIERLKAKYTPDLHGIDNFSKYFFKDGIIQQVKNGLQWHEKLHPVFQYAYEELRNGYIGTESIFYDGVDVQFSEYNPKPSFLIEYAKISVNDSIGVFSGEIENLTNQQYITGQPTSFKLGGKNFAFAESIDISGIINRVNLDQIKDTYSIAIENQRIKEKQFGISDSWSFLMEDGLVSKNMQIDIMDGKINGNIKFNYSDVTFKSNYSGESNIIVNAIDSILTDVSNFYANIYITGNTANLSTTVSSDIDNIISQAVNSLIIKETNKILVTVENHVTKQTEEINQQVQQELEKLKLELAKIEQILDEITEIFNSLP